MCKIEMKKKYVWWINNVNSVVCSTFNVKCSWDGLLEGRNCSCVWSFWCSVLCSVDQTVTVQRGSVLDAGACLEGGHGVAPAPLKICGAPPCAPPNSADWSEYNIYGTGAVRVHLKSHALLLMSYTNRQCSAAWSRTHPLTVWFAANYFPYTMPLD